MLAVVRVVIATAWPCRYSAPRVRFNVAGMSDDHNRRTAIQHPHSLWCTECPRCKMHQAPLRAVDVGCCFAPKVHGCPFEPGGQQ